MNAIVINSREWLREFQNGASFGSNLTEFTAFPKFLLIERVKYTTSITVRTEVFASPTTPIVFTDLGTTCTFEHPYANWATEGFKIGDTIRVKQGADFEDVTISAIAGTLLTVNDAGFTSAPMNLVSGDSYDDLEFYNTTVPTSLVFQFGIVPNVADPSAPILSPNPYSSWVDGQVQAYKADGIAGSPTALTSTMTPNAETTETLTCEYVGVTGVHEFTFEIIHIFRVEFFRDEYLQNMIDNTSPTSFVPPASYRYVSFYKFGTDSSDTNEYRVYKDSLLNGAAGWINNNFNLGTGDYNLVSCTYGSGSQLEVTETNAVTIQIEKTSAGNFPVGQKAIVVISKLPSLTEMAFDPSAPGNTWEDIRAFDQLTQEDGVASVDGVYIQNLIVDVNATPTLIDITFDVIYDAAAQAFLNEGDRYFIGVIIGDETASAATADHKVVWCDVNTYTKNSDIPDLIQDLNFGLYTSEKRPGVGLKTTNADSWDNRLHIALVTFTLDKFANSADCNITALKGQVVSRNSVTGESFLLDNFNIPMGKWLNVVVDGTTYQAIDKDGLRNFNIKSDAYANTWSLVSDVPASFDATQLWTVSWPFVFNWRSWQSNPNVPTEFYDSAEDQNNLNYKTSNYSGVGNWVIYIRLFAVVNYQGVDTEYGLYSEPCVVRDFDVDPDGFNWSATTQLFDEDDNEVDYLIAGQDIRIKTTFSMATAGGLTLSRLVGEHTIEEYNSLGSNWRLNSNKDWSYDENVLKPIVGENFVKVTQDVPNNQIIIESLIDKDLVDPAKSYNVYSHLQDTT